MSASRGRRGTGRAGTGGAVNRLRTERQRQIVALSVGIPVIYALFVIADYSEDGSWRGAFVDVSLAFVIAGVFLVIVVKVVDWIVRGDPS